MPLVLLQRGVKELGLANPGWLFIVTFIWLIQGQCSFAEHEKFVTHLQSSCTRRPQRQFSVLPCCEGTDLVGFPRGCAEELLPMFYPVSACRFLMWSALKVVRADMLRNVNFLCSVHQRQALRLRWGWHSLQKNPPSVARPKNYWKEFKNLTQAKMCFRPVAVQLGFQFVVFAVHFYSFCVKANGGTEILASVCFTALNIVSFCSC